MQLIAQVLVRMALTIVQVANVSGPILDKLSYVLSVSSIAEEKLIRDALISLNACKECRRVPRPLYFDSFAFFDESGSSAPITIQCSPRNLSQKAFLRVDYNPAKIATSYIASYLDFIVPGGYKRMVEDAKITRFDVAVDVIGVDINELIVYPGKCRKSQIFFNKNKTESEYYGDRKSPWSLVVYNKIAEAKVHGTKCSVSAMSNSNKCTRIEVRAKPKGGDLLLKDLGKAGNQLSKISISQYSSIASKQQSMQMALEISKHTNIKNGLSFLEPYQKKQFIKLIKTYKCGWWNPYLIWSGWPDSVGHVLETDFDQIALAS